MAVFQPQEGGNPAICKTRIDPEGMMCMLLSERSQTKKRQILYDLTFMWNVKSPTQSKRVVVTMARGLQNMGRC